MCFVFNVHTIRMQRIKREKGNELTSRTFSIVATLHVVSITVTKRTRMSAALSGFGSERDLTARGGERWRRGLTLNLWKQIHYVNIGRHIFIIKDLAKIARLQVEKYLLFKIRRKMNKKSFSNEFWRKFVHRLSHILIKS